MNWYYSNGDNTVGPLSLMALKELHACGVLHDDSKVRRDGSDEWMRYLEAFREKDGKDVAQARAREERGLIKFHCSHCQQKLSVEAAQSGRKVQCPACGADLLIPHQNEKPHISCASRPHPHMPSPGTNKSPLVKIACTGSVAAAVAVAGIWVYSNKTERANSSVRTDQSHSPESHDGMTGKSHVPSADEDKFLIGEMHYRGNGVPQDFALAIQYFREAADKGDPRAQNALASMYCKGEGLQEDPVEALVLWSKAAAQGFHQAQYMVGMTNKTQGDLRAAYIWLNLASSSENQGLAQLSAKERDAVATNMTRDEIADAQKRCSQWRPGNDRFFGLFLRSDKPDTAITSSAVDKKYFPPNPNEPITLSNYREGDPIREFRQLADVLFLRIYLLGFENRAALQYYEKHLFDPNYRVRTDFPKSYESRLLAIAKIGAEDSMKGKDPNKGQQPRFVIPDGGGNDETKRLTRLEVLEKYFGQKEKWQEKHGFSILSQRVQPEDDVRYEAVVAADFMLRFEKAKEAIKVESANASATSEIPIIDKGKPPKTVEKPLSSLSVLRDGSLDEAKECIRMLDEDLKINPHDERIRLVKSTIMDVFRAEASLVSALKERQDADKKYEIKMQNLQIASRPSPLTGRVNTGEVERIRREANEIKSASEARINAARSELRKSLDSATRSIPAPDKDLLTEVWKKIKKRHNL